MHHGDGLTGEGYAYRSLMPMKRTKQRQCHTDTCSQTESENMSRHSSEKLFEKIFDRTDTYSKTLR